MLQLADDSWAALAPPAATGLALHRSIRILVVNEQPLVQYGVRLFLHGVEGIRAIDTASSGREALAAARAERHEIVLLDPWLSDMLLEDLVRRLAAVSPGSRVVLFGEPISPSLREEAEALDIRGVLDHDATHERLIEAIALVAAGERLIDRGSDQMLQRAAAKVHGTPLTPREHEILRRAARGESNAEIAGAIYLAPTTVKSYLQSALRKLGARNRVEAVFKLSELRIL